MRDLAPPLIILAGLALLLLTPTLYSTVTGILTPQPCYTETFNLRVPPDPDGPEPLYDTVLVLTRRGDSWCDGLDARLVNDYRPERPLKAEPLGAQGYTIVVSLEGLGWSKTVTVNPDASVVEVNVHDSMLTGLTMVAVKVEVYKP